MFVPVGTETPAQGNSTNIAAGAGYGKNLLCYK